MLLNTLRYIREDDIIVIAPEYDHFIGEAVHGAREMVITLADVDNFELLNDLSIKQLKRLLIQSPRYCLEKLNPWSYFIPIDKYGIYGKYSFNEFGDAVSHYNLPNEDIKPMFSPYKKTNFNANAVQILNAFADKCYKANARVYISYPSFHSTNSDGSNSLIDYVDSTLKANDLYVISNPYDYIMADTLFFNTSYHLNKTGVDIRTYRLIRDLNKIIKPFEGL
jgi:hypothetical protein